MQAVRAEIDAGVNVVDMTFLDEHMKFKHKALNNRVTVILGCGVAPGLSNMFAGYGASRVNSVEECLD